MAKTKYTKSAIKDFTAKYPGAFAKSDVFAVTPVSGNNWHLFYEGTCGDAHQLWLPEDIANSSMSIANKIKKIEAAFASAKHKKDYNLYEAARSCGSISWGWFDITEGRLQLLGKLIELTQKARGASASKSSELAKAEADLEKAKKKVADLKKKTAESTKISENTQVRKNVAFVKLDNSVGDAFKYVSSDGTVDLCFSSIKSCGKDNQIDHVINMYKKRVAQTNDLITELLAAKKAGAEYVIDEEWESPSKFHF